MARFPLSSLVLCLAAGIQAAALALPEPAFPEVIPGPGLPSLKELNLTSAQLHAMGPPNEGKSSSPKPSFAIPSPSSLPFPWVLPLGQGESV